MAIKEKWRLLKCCGVFFCTLALIGLLGLAGEVYHRPAAPAIELVGERLLIPGGQSVGIQMDVRGVLVVGLEELETEDGIVSPGYEAGLTIGDTIIAIDGTPVYYARDVARIIAGKRKPMTMDILRGKEPMTVSVRPVKTYGDGSYKVGIWVKERIAGIGTLTFYDPQTRMFASLGHGIYEPQTNTLLTAGDGKLLRTEVSAIEEGKAGKPGQIRGVFYDDEEALGQVAQNSQYGVYATSFAASAGEDGIVEAEPMVMATQEQVKEGPATILTTIQGRQVESFSVEIVAVHPQREAGSKGLELKVTDERLLAFSGGIVQGMSGSPIIQNGRLVGAVTHVFVDDPTKGYGIFAQWMVETCENIALAD